ncbi:hypothetical protein BKA01_000447 [Pseudonocardia eucalypti]|uniref:hypothetical protein n=1 Tax=Pseudonocardia eucalypti TaxID=648755 RepID=UPI00161F08ED|nr:hypothetical protein [Pseudonocardia eucalypti]
MEALAGATSFRFGDVNPRTGKPYTWSHFRELPAYAAEVVVGKFDLCAGEWDALVDTWAVDEFVDPEQVFTVDVGAYARSVAGRLSYGEMSLAVAWSGVELPERGASVSREQVLALAALGIRRPGGLLTLCTTEARARDLRRAGDFGAASEIYGGKAREDRAHDLAFSVIPLPAELDEPAEYDSDVVAVVA